MMFFKSSIIKSFPLTVKMDFLTLALPLRDPKQPEQVRTLSRSRFLEEVTGLECRFPLLAQRSLLTHYILFI